MNSTRLPQLAVVAALLATPVLTGCGSTSTRASGSTSATGAAEPTAGGKVTFATDKEVDCFDPQVSQADVTGVILRNVYDSLVVQRKDGSYGPWLATKLAAGAMWAL